MKTAKSSPIKAAFYFLVTAMVACGLQAQDDQITWGAHNNITADSDVSTAGTLVGTYSPYLIQNPGINSITINGVAFQSNSVNAYVIGMTNSTVMGITTNASGSVYLADANYANLLTGASDSPYDTPASLTISNLTAGASYQIEIWVQDAYYNSPGYDQWENFQNLAGHGTTGDSANMNYDENHTAVSGECIGHYILGTFTASNTVQFIAISNAMEWTQQLPSGTIVNTYGQAQINLLQLRETSAPPPQDQVTWGTVEPISGDSDVVTNQSVLIGTYSPYLMLNPTISSILINGVAFQSNSLHAITSGLTNSTTMGINANLIDTNYANLLTGAGDGTFGAESGYLLISNVIPGNEYEVELWAQNVNDTNYDQWENFWTITTGNESASVNYDNGGIGHFVTGTFIPTASNSIVEIGWVPWSQIGSGSINQTFGQGQVNLVQLRLVQVPAAVSQQPPGTTYVAYGSNVTVTAVAGGSPSLSYQWYETNLTAMTGELLSGQTNASLTLSNLTASDNYYLEVTNAFGSTNSSVASVVVYTSPIIISQLPVTYTNPFTLYAGANPAFSVSALGTTTLGYRWFTNGVLNGAASGSNFTQTAVALGTMVSNYCIVSNSFGSATSVVWVASVIAAPAALYPRAVLALNPIGYWRLNDTNLDGVDDGGPGGVGNDGTGDDGWICHDYVGGNNGVYTNVSLGNPGYDPTDDPSDTSAQFGETGISYFDSLANGIAGINFGAPSGASAAFTVEAWVNGYTPSYDGGIVTLGWGGGGEQFNLDTGANDPAHDFRFFIRDASGGTHGVNSSIAPTFGAWYHLAAVVDEVSTHEIAFYINGQSVGTASVSSGSGILSSSYLMGIGSRLGSQTSDYNDQFLGNINDVAVFNYALSPAQVAYQYAVAITNAPFFAPAPETNAAANAGATLTIPVAAFGTAPMTYWWTNVTAGAAIATGVTNSSAALNATLNYPNVPANWNGDTLELTVSNAYGMINSLVTLAIANINSNPTNILFGVTNQQLSLTWPADHTGWQLQVQTNRLSAGISTNWVNVTGSTGTNQMLIPINLTNGSVFYRLIYNP